MCFNFNNNASPPPPFQKTYFGGVGQKAVSVNILFMLALRKFLGGIC